MDFSRPDPAMFDVPFTTEEFRGMPYRLLGRSGLRVSSVGLGTWKMGLPESGDGARVDERTSYAILDRALELGVTFWDTANRYNAGSGNAERIIGRWLRRHPDERRNVIIATKVYGGMDGRTPNHSGLSRMNILDAVHACLERLQCGHIDLLYFHRFDPTTPVQESLCAVLDLVRQDLVRYFAVSNFTADQLALYAETEARLGVRSRVLAVQNRYDIVRGEAEAHRGVLEYAAREGVSFVAYSPLALGLLTERYLDPGRAGPGDRLVDEGALEHAASPEVLGRVRRLAELAHGWGLRLSQLALAYMLGLPGMGPAIPSASTVAQLEENAAAGRVVLSPEQREAVRQVVGV